MRRALLISPYFTPSNIACVQRVRLMATRLHEFGWQPIVVTLDSRCYEEANDPESLALLPDCLRVERVPAWPARICRPLGLGDVSLRGQGGMRRKVVELAEHGEADVVFVTVLPGYTSLIGAWAKRKFKLPFVLDYQDPWVSHLSVSHPRFSKAHLANWLARKIEPRVVPMADALTAVSDETLFSLRARELIAADAEVQTIPIGADAEDHQIAARAGRSGIVKQPGVCNLAYVGTITERMLPALRILLLAVKQIAEGGKRVGVHLIGTSARTNAEDTVGITRMIEEIGVTNIVRLQPRRVPYLDALRTMQDADALLLLGSTDSHYTASKIFPCWLAKRPIVGVFHEASTVNQLARQLGGVRLVTYKGAHELLSKVNEVAATLAQVISDPLGTMADRDESAFEPFSGRGTAAVYASLFDKVLDRARRG
jgi:hypothetical protein